MSEHGPPQALSAQQQLAYARDLRRIYATERARREELEIANRALESANAELTRRIDSLLAAHDWVLAVNSSRELRELIDRLAESLRGLLCARATIVFPWEEQAGQLGAALGSASGAPAATLTALAASPLSAHVLTTGVVTEAPDLGAADREGPTGAAAARALGWSALVASPLSARGARLGLLYVAWDQPHQIDDRERMLLRLVAQHTSASLANARALAETTARASALERSERQLMRYAHDMRPAYEAERARRAQVQAAYLTTVKVLAAAIETRDPYTGGHVERVATISLAVGRELAWADEALTALELGALLHDVGKIGVADRILRKPARLNPEEETQMRRHAELGARILRDVPFLVVPTRCALRHHERFDGLGYPGGLSADTIPMEARIIAVADTYDAMTTDRPYRRGLPTAVALAEIDRCTGTQFDPTAAAAFLRAVRSGALVLTNRS